MPASIEYDVKELLERISGKLDNLDRKFEQKIGQLSEDIKRVEIAQTRLEGEIKILDEKVDGINKRLDFQEFINRSVLGGVVIAIIIGLIKFLGFIPGHSA